MSAAGFHVKYPARMRDTSSSALCTQVLFPVIGSLYENSFVDIAPALFYNVVTNRIIQENIAYGKKRVTDA